MMVGLILAKLLVDKQTRKTKEGPGGQKGKRGQKGHPLFRGIRRMKPAAKIKEKKMYDVFLIWSKNKKVIKPK